MNGLLYRAVAYVRGSNASEVHVFFEAPPLTNPGTTLLQLLASIWYTSVNSIEIENLIEEYTYLSHWALGDKETGDARLLEVGAGDGQIHYCDPTRTLFLVSPSVLQRLVKAQERAAFLQVAGAIDPECLRIRTTTLRTTAAA